MNPFFGARRKCRGGEGRGWGDTIEINRDSWRLGEFVEFVEFVEFIECIASEIFRD
jgi:hypothetical protein